MVTDSFLKHLFGDDQSLGDYVSGHEVSIDDVRRRVFLLARAENSRIPDHHYRLVQERTFRGLSTIGDVISIGIPELSVDYLEYKKSKIYVKQGSQHSWQELITRIPPLFLLASFLHRRTPLASLEGDYLLQYFLNAVLPNCIYSALPIPYIPQLETFIESKRGLQDLHMHLNGATETDSVWQDFLASPDSVYNEFAKATSDPKVREQIEQESHFFEPLRFRHLLLVARRLRHTIFEILFPESDKTIASTIAEAIKNINVTGSVGELTSSYHHPFLGKLQLPPDYEHLMAVECMMYLLILRHLEVEKSDSLVGSLFHYYLLILGQVNRLLVQQIHQNGFEQFQKLTLNGLREDSEKDFRKRFFQIHGNEMRHIAFLEGRFSPKQTVDANIELLATIEAGWNCLRTHLADLWNDGERNIFPEPELKLIAHFIKRPEEMPRRNVRHRTQREDNWLRARALSMLIRDHKRYSGAIVGIDAAASEFDASPEVFAPAFRYLKKGGSVQLTYHAGEDFHHILSGLRAVYEAIYFIEMRNGDRIGHATATGINANEWLQRIGEKLLIRQGEWLDNLVFAYHLIINENDPVLRQTLPYLTYEILELASAIYSGHFSLKALEDAWRLRRLCPMHYFSAEDSTAQALSVFDRDEWRLVIEQRKRFHTSDANIILELYHGSARDKYDAIIEIRPDKVFSGELVTRLQRLVLKKMHENEIVIETLPTSNVRIGHHMDYSTYHLWNWINWEEEGFPIPPIVVGSDDTGIFATSIYNEYAHIYCHLIGKGNQSHSNAMDVIKRLDENSRVYRFQN